MVDIPKTIKRLTDTIVREFHPEKIILFGSYAWGKPRPDSDVDLLVVKPSAEKRWEREYELRSKLFGNNFPPLDFLIYTPEELEHRLAVGDFLVQDILNKGTMLYGH